MGSCFKHRWTTRKQAKAALKKQRGGTRRLKSAYECRRCGMWHLSHLTVKEYEQKVADWLLIKFLEDDLK